MCLFYFFCTLDQHRVSAVLILLVMGRVCNTDFATFFAKNRLSSICVDVCLCILRNVIFYYNSLLLCLYYKLYVNSFNFFCPVSFGSREMSKKFWQPCAPTKPSLLILSCPFLVTVGGSEHP